MLSVKNLHKTYKLSKTKDSDARVVHALNGVTIDFPDKGMVFLLGKSGSGKSTLLNCIGGLDTFDEGEIIIKGQSSKTFQQSDFDSYRNTFIGFIFQEYNILDEFSIGKNLSLALELQGKKADRDAVNKLLEEVDLKGFYKRKPNQLSGGQKQRVAIARALIKEPEIIMADEPTGALDSNTGKQVMETLKKLSKTKLVIVVSHDREFAEIYGDRVIELKDGRIIADDSKYLVEAQKSASGVSYLDNIVHIKKGQKLSVNDFDKISKMIIENSHDSDIIISFDEKANTQVKKANFITEDGNQEVLKPTQSVIQQKYDPNKFKLIKSRLHFGDALKMGAGSLKHKPIRLVFTILLAVVAFGLFGLVDTFASFNSVNSLYDTIQSENYSALPFLKQTEVKENDYSWLREDRITNSDIEKLKIRLGEGYEIYPVINGASGDYFHYSGIDFQISGLDKKAQTSAAAQSNPVLNNVYSGFMQIDSSIQENLGLTLTEGRLPVKSDEVCISQNIFDNIKYSYNADSFADINGDTTSVKFSSYYSYEEFKIVGVLKDTVDVSNQRSSQDENFLQQYTMQYLAGAGLTNMVYVSKQGFSMLNTNSDSVSIQTPYYWYSSSSLYRPSTFANSHPSTEIYYKTGYNENTTGEWLIIDDQQASSMFGIDKYDDEFYDGYSYTYDHDKYLAALMQKVNDGAYLQISDNNNQPLANIEIAGIVDGEYDSFLIFSDQAYSKYLFKGNESYTYAVVALKRSADDKGMLRSLFEVVDDVKYSIQTPAAKNIDNFGDMIGTMSQVFLYVGIGLAVFASLMLMNFISTSIAYKRREIGVLRAIGARGKDVFAIFFLEALIICLINFALATIGCGIAAFFINRTVIGAGISLTLLSFGVRQIILIFGVSLLAAFISSFLPVYKIAKKNPIDSINGR